MCQDQLKDPKMAGWISLALVFISMSLLLPDFFHPAGQLSKDWFDGVRGLLAGLGIGMELMVVIKLARQRRLGRS